MSQEKSNLPETGVRNIEIPEGWVLDRVKPISPSLLRVYFRKVEPPNESLAVKVVGDSGR